MTRMRRLYKIVDVLSDLAKTKWKLYYVQVVLVVWLQPKRVSELFSLVLTNHKVYNLSNKVGTRFLSATVTSIQSYRFAVFIFFFKSFQVSGLLQHSIAR